MNVYDTANRLAREIKESNEYIRYKQLKEEVNNNSNIKEQIDEFEKNRYLVQISQMQGEENNQEKTKQLEDMYKELIKNEKIKEYFEQEVKFNMLLADVNKIIAESVKDVL